MEEGRGLTVVINMCVEETMTYSVVTLVSTHCIEDKCLIPVLLVLAGLVWHVRVRIKNT